jgi:hypothetical protein
MNGKLQAKDLATLLALFFFLLSPSRDTCKKCFVRRALRAFPEILSKEARPAKEMVYK